VESIRRCTILKSKAIRNISLKIIVQVKPLLKPFDKFGEIDSRRMFSL